MLLILISSLSFTAGLSFLESALEKLARTEDFNSNNYEEVVTIYIYWKETILPTLATEEEDGHHLCFGQQVYNILHLYAPEHHILHFATEKYIIHQAQSYLSLCENY